MDIPDLSNSCGLAPYFKRVRAILFLSCSAAQCRGVCEQNKQEKQRMHYGHIKQLANTVSTLINVGKHTV